MSCLTASSVLLFDPRQSTRKSQVTSLSPLRRCKARNRTETYRVGRFPTYRSRPVATRVRDVSVLLGFDVGPYVGPLISEKPNGEASSHRG